MAISATGAATQVFGVETLIEAARLLNGSVAAEPVSVNVAELFDCEPEYPVDFAEIKGQLRHPPWVLNGEDGSVGQGRERTAFTEQGRVRKTAL